MTMNKVQQSNALGVLAGACALAIGIGFQRSDFAVLGQIMANQKIITDSDIGTLAGTSLAGYIIGCIHQTKIKSEYRSLQVIATALAVCVASFIIEPLIPSLGWHALWRLISGWASAHLVTGLPSFAVRNIEQSSRRSATALIFAGGGFGALIGSVGIGVYASSSVPGSWFITFLISVILALPITMFLKEVFREQAEARKAKSLMSASNDEAKISKVTPQVTWTASLKLFAATIFFFGAAQVTIITYQPLLLVSRLNVSQEMASESFGIFGIGYTIGAIAAGFMPRKWSTDLLLQISALLGVTGSLLCYVGTSVAVINSGAFLFAFWNGAMIGLIVARLGEIVGPVQARKYWAIFSLILSIGYISYTFTSAWIATFSIPSIFSIGLGLTIVHFAFMFITARAFAKDKILQPG